MKLNYLLYACAYTALTICVYAIVRVTGIDRNVVYADLASLLAGFVFAIVFPPKVLGVFLSGALFSLIFTLDYSMGVNWFSGPKSMDSAWMIVFAGVGWALPLIMVWVLMHGWRFISGLWK